MGCTHYPVLERVIASTVGKGVSIINTGKETAKTVEKTLRQKRMISDSGRGGCEYFVTDSPDTFKEIGGRFLEEELKDIKFVKSLDYKDFLLSS
jgi:glutamate racemase